MSNGIVNKLEESNQELDDVEVVGKLDDVEVVSKLDDVEVVRNGLEKLSQTLGNAYEVFTRLRGYIDSTNREP